MVTWVTGVTGVSWVAWVTGGELRSLLFLKISLLEMLIAVGYTFGGRWLS